MKNNCIIIGLLLASLSISLYGQHTISGKVTDNNNQALEFCNALLLNAIDSSLLNGVVCDAEGKFSIPNVKSGEYLIAFSFIGFETTYQSIELDQSKDIGNISIASSGINIDAIMVTARRPMFEQKIDRMVVNVQNSITSAGTTVLEVLQKSPGVIVNRQSGTVSMSGKDGVQVMINGKLSYMPSSALLTMLDGMSSNNVDKIELITTPPAKYDAGGNAGYINIVLKQSPDEGLNGNLSLTMAAFYGTAPAASLDLNQRNGKLNLYGSYSFSRDAQRQFFNSYRKINIENIITETTIMSDRDPSQLNNNVRIGLDYQFSPKTTIGVLASGYNNKWSMDAINTSDTKINNQKDTSISITNDELNQWKHGMINTNISHKTEHSGDFSINVDFLTYDNKNPNNYLNTYNNGNNELVRNEKTRSGKHTIIKILPVQLDHQISINSKLSLESGAKMVMSTFTNDVEVANLNQNQWVSDDEFTANYRLKENIYAGYSSFSYSPSNNNVFKAGLRYEHTSSNLGTEKTANIVDRKYGQFFPTLYWSHTINTHQSFNLSYNRRINRPTFNNLAPFLIFIDPNTFISGNAALQPSIADGIKADFVYKSYAFSVGYTHEDNTISDFQPDINTQSNKQYFIAQNLHKTQTLNSTISLPVSITSWWFAQTNINGTWQQVQGDYKESKVTLSQFNYNISGFQSFTIVKDFNFECSGFFQSPSLMGISKGKSFGMLNLGIQKKFDNSTLKFGVDDIFSSMRWTTIIDLPAENIYSNNFLQFSRRIFKLTYTQSFGNKILKAKRSRSTASDDVQQRVR
jgi:hypothetical protein